MVDFAAISKGFNERQDYNRNKRLEVMELFEEFKRNNPEATMADFQSFRDQVSGGRNYLRGGVGNDAALKRIVDTNERKRQQAAAARSQSEAMQKLQFMRELQPFIDNELVNMQEIKGGPANQYSSYDTAGAIKNVKDMFGGSLPFDMDITNMMSEGNRSRAVQSMVFKKLPQAREYIGDLTDPSQANAGELATLLQVPQTVAQQLLDSATKEYEATQGEKLRGLGRIITGEIEKIAAKPDITWEEVTSVLDKQYGDDPLYEKWKGSNLDGSKSVFENTNEVVKAKIDDDLRIETNKVIDKARGSLLAIIQRKGIAEASAELKKLLTRRLGKDTVANLDDEYLKGEVDALYMAMQELQEEQYRSKRAAQNVANLELTNKQREVNEARINGAFDSQDGKFNKDAELLDIARGLASVYHIDDRAITLMGAVAENIDPDASYEDKKAALVEALGGQKTFDEHVNQMRELSSAKSGVLEPQTFDTYYDSKVDEVVEINTKISSMLTDITRDTSSAENKIKMLRALKTKITDEGRHFQNVIAADRLASRGTISDQGENYTWLDPETPWDQDLASGLAEDVSRRIMFVDEEIQRQQKYIKERDANRTEAARTIGDAENAANPSNVTNDSQTNDTVNKVASSVSQGNTPTAQEFVKIMVDDLNIPRPMSLKEYQTNFAQDFNEFVNLMAQKGTPLSQDMINQIANEMMPKGLGAQPLRIEVTQ